MGVEGSVPWALGGERVLADGEVVVLDNTFKHWVYNEAAMDRSESQAHPTNPKPHLGPWPVPPILVPILVPIPPAARIATCLARLDRWIRFRVAGLF